MRIARRLAAAGDGQGWSKLESELESHLTAFRAMLARPALRAALSRAAYHPFPASRLPARVATELAQGEVELTLHRELRISARREGRLLSGQADRVVLLSRGDQRLAAEVLDFKTDKFDAADAQALAAKTDFYRPQLTAYCEAVAQMFRLDPQCVCAKLLFVEQGVVAEV